MRHCLLKPGLLLHVGELREVLHVQLHGMSLPRRAKGTAGAGPSSLARNAVLEASFGPGACLSRTQLSLIAGCLETDQSLNFPEPCFHPYPLSTGMQVHLETAFPFQASTFLSWLVISHL